MSRSVILLSLVLGLALLPSEVPPAALPLLRQEWGASATAGGWVVSAYQAGYVLAVLVLLPLTDRVPAERVIVVCSAVMGLAFLLFALMAHDVWSAAALRALTGAALAGVYMPGVRVVAHRSTPERRGLAVGAFVSIFYLATSLSFWATGALLPLLGWRGAALLLGAISLLGAPLALLAARGAASPTGRSARLRPSVLASLPVRCVVFGYVGHSWELYVSRGWLPSFLAALLIARGSDTLAATAQAGQAAALMMSMGTLGVLLGGWVSDRAPRARAALSIALPCSLLSFAFGWLGGLPWTLLLGLGMLYGLLLAADSAIYSTAITELPPRELVGSAQAMQAFLGFLATAVAPVGAGALLDLGLGWGWVFGLAGAGALLGALGLLPLARGARRESRVASY